VLQDGRDDNLFMVDEQVQSAERMFAQYGGFIASIIRFFVKDPSEQEDIYQELFLFFMRKPIPGDVRNIKGFLYRVIGDRIRDRKRRQVRYQQNLEKYADRSNREPREEVSSVATVHQKEQAERVFSLMKDYLTRNEAMAITLRYKDDCDIHETARRMNVQPKTVSRYVCVGLKKIRDVFGRVERLHEEGE
jgi:RNA polymerase sigma factor (sigma-70 family)